MPRHTCLGSILLILALLPHTHADDRTPPWIAQGRHGLVASDSAYASQIGADVLAHGGNAFDAAIATSLALAVTRPYSTGLGGGGFMVAWRAETQQPVVLDFREVAPAAATPERYVQLIADARAGPPPTIYGGNAVGVPGQIAGLKAIHERFATRPLHELVAPAIRLASEGFPADEHYVSACESALADYDKWPQMKQQQPLANLYRTLLHAGRAPAVGERVQRPDLVRAFFLLEHEGPDAFYGGTYADTLARTVQAAGGTLTRDDLTNYKVVERVPLRAPFTTSDNHTYELISMPPPSSGGICLAETLHILDAARERSDLQPGPHVLVEAMKHAFADRSRWLGDPAFCEIPVERLLSMPYAIACAKTIQPDGTLPPNAYGSSPTPPEDRGTSHFCVVDRAGNVVAMTETINGTFGSFLLLEPYGVLLNNQLDDFALNPGQPNLYGLVQGTANAIAPGKRPLSSMSPTIVLADGQPVFALGASGGPRIITSVLQVLLGVLDDHLSLADAMTRVRLHHQWLPDEVSFDQVPPATLVETLQQHGHTLSETRRTGIVQAIQRLSPDEWVGASDPRKGGRPAAASR